MWGFQSDAMIHVGRDDNSLNIDYICDMIKPQKLCSVQILYRKKFKGRGICAASLYCYYTIKIGKIQDLYRLRVEGILHISKEVCVWVDKIGWSY